DLQGSAPQDPVDQVELVLDIVDPQQRDVPAAAGDDAGPGDQSLRGQRVGRGPPVQHRDEDEPADDQYGDAPRHPSDVAVQLGTHEVVDEHGGRKDHHQPEERLEQHLRVRTGADDDVL